MEIKRELYLNHLISRKENGLVKVITGIRRCGKSFLLNTIFYHHLITMGVSDDHIIRFAFDSADDLKKINEDLIEIEKKHRKVDPHKFMAYISNHITDSSMYYLLLDEIQMLDCFESVLNGYLRRNNVDVYVTGSNARFLSKDIITEFSGRGDEIRLYPLSFSEFMSVYSGDKYEGLSEYMMYGGIPLVVLRQNDNEKARLLQNLFDEIYIKDILKRNNIKKQAEFEDLINILSSSVGSLTNTEKIKNTFHSVKKSNISAVTISKYLECLDDAFLIDSAHRYDIKGRHYIETPRKYYFSDTGLRNARIGFRQFEQTHLMENIIYNELKIRGYNVDIGIVPVTQTNHNGSTVTKQLEIDFLCNLGSKRYYIQSAYSMPDQKKREQEIRPFVKAGDSFKKIIVTHDVVKPFYDDNGILTMSIYDFLLDRNSMDT